MSTQTQKIMWSDQPLFRLALETIAQGVVTKLGLKLPVDALLVGTELKEPPGELCLEMGELQWELDWFDRFHHTWGEVHELLNHQNCSTLRCAEHRRRIAFQNALKKVLESRGFGAVFVGYPEQVNDHLVAPVLRLPLAEIEGLPHPEGPTYRIGDRLWKSPDSLFDSAMEKVLEYASEALRSPQPGGDLRGFSREYMDICRAAAKGFMYRAAWAAGARSGLNLFECCNEIASLYHEGLGTRGRLLFCHPDRLREVLKVEFRRYVPITETGWSRKLVGVSSTENSLVVSATGGLGLSICGIGDLDEFRQEAGPESFVVDFTGHHKWQVVLQGECLMHVRYGLPTIPTERMDRAYLRELYCRLFPDRSERETATILSMADAAIEQRHGTMLVVSEEAEAEGMRLESQGTSVIPTRLTPQLLRLVTSIDGAVLLDPAGRCHGVGVILDGPATPEGSPARGARYNSAIRYLSAHPGCLIIVVSEDGPVDVFPKREPPVDDRMDARLRRLREMSADPTFDQELTHSLLQWLNENRSYLNGSQCGALNECVESLRERWDPSRMAVE